MMPAAESLNWYRRPRWLTHREQMLIAFVLAILVVGGIVSQIRNIRPAEAPELQTH